MMSREIPVAPRTISLVQDFEMMGNSWLLVEKVGLYRSVISKKFLYVQVFA